MPYNLEGTMLEICNCDVLCPCWIGEDPDRGTCDAVQAYHVNEGMIDGVDVSGRVVGLLTHLPGNALKGGWKVALVVDDKATDKQAEVLISAWSGELGGPLADMAALVGEVVAVVRAPITYDVTDGKGTLLIGGMAQVQMEPYRDPAGRVTTLDGSALTGLLGAPAIMGKALRFQRESAEFGLKDLDLQGHNAVQGGFRFAA